MKIKDEEHAAESILQFGCGGALVTHPGFNVFFLSFWTGCIINIWQTEQFIQRERMINAQVNQVNKWRKETANYYATVNLPPS